MNYDVQFFIDLFEAIPEEKWVVGVLGRDDKHCANGHCGVNDYTTINDKAKALGNILSPLRRPNWPAYGGDVLFEITANINDGHTQYRQPTPKQRILAALYDIKAMQERKDIDTGGKVKTVYVAVPVTISEQAKELVLS